MVNRQGSLTVQRRMQTIHVSLPDLFDSESIPPNVAAYAVRIDAITSASPIVRLP